MVNFTFVPDVVSNVSGAGCSFSEAEVMAIAQMPSVLIFRFLLAAFCLILATYAFNLVPSTHPAVMWLKKRVYGVLDAFLFVALGTPLYLFFLKYGWVSEYYWLVFCALLLCSVLLWRFLKWFLKRDLEACL